MSSDRLLIWSIHETAGFDTAWASVSGGRLTAEGRAAGLRPSPYWVSYRLETDDDFVHRRMTVEARWAGGSASLDLRREDGRWTVDGDERPDLADALDCDLAACPMTNTMPILRHGLHRGAGANELLMAFIQVPSLRVVPSRQRYEQLRLTDEAEAIVRYSSGSFSSDLRIDEDGFVVDYPKLGHRVEPVALPEGIRASGPGSVRPD